MKQLFKLSAFPKEENGGNLAGVYLYGDNLNQLEMQKIAYDLGYSETAFVSNSQCADYKVRFFTPKYEVDLCGHATIATFNLLRKLKIIKDGCYSQETKAGILKIEVANDLVFMEQPSPQFGSYISKEELSQCFKNIEFHQDLPPQILSTGLREIFIPLKNRSILDKVKANFKKIINLSRKYQVIGVHLFSLDENVDAYGRIFAPILGINEESATGTSNGALACYLYHHHHKKNTYTFRQGYQMNQPSEIIVRLSSSNNQIESVWVGGSANEIKEK